MRRERRGLRGSGSWRESKVVMERGGNVIVEGRRCRSGVGDLRGFKVAVDGLLVSRSHGVLRRGCVVVVVVFVLVPPPWA
jgi:hypothetical protein